MMIALYFFCLLIGLMALTVLGEKLVRQRMQGPAKWMLLSLIFLVPFAWLCMRVGFAVHFMNVFGAPWWVPGTELGALLVFLAGGIWIRRKMSQPESRLNRLPIHRLVMGLLTGLIGVVLVRIHLVGQGADHLITQTTQEREELLTLFPPKKPGDTEAREVYMQFYRSMDQDSSRKDLLDLSNLGLNDPNFIAEYRAQQPYLNMARSAADHAEYRIGKAISSLGYMDDHPEISALREANTILRIAARVDASQGDFEGAGRDLARAYNVVKHMQSDWALAFFILNCALKFQTDHAAAELLSRAHTFEQLNSIQVPQFDWQAEYHRNLRVQIILMRQLFRRYVSQGGAEVRYSVAGSIWLPTILRQGDLQFSAVEQVAIQAASVPFANLASPSGASQPPVAGILQSMLYDSPVKSNQALRDAQSTSIALELALAATRYRLQQGRYPQSIGELFPAYVLVWPSDPYKPGTPMHMKILSDGSLVFYSVGQNIIDDGGDVLYDTTRGMKMLDAGILLEPAKAP